MIWIHGGGFKDGYASYYDGGNLTSSPWTHKQQIIVTINYRLGAFGFLALDELRKRDDTSGNYGLLDQQAALSWVHDNIFAFGGDSARVTLFGESAGGLSVVSRYFTYFLRAIVITLGL
jgi:para-nitrobenzyl esterase